MNRATGTLDGSLSAPTASLHDRATARNEKTRDADLPHVQPRNSEGITKMPHTSQLAPGVHRSGPVSHGRNHRALAGIHLPCYKFNGRYNFLFARRSLHVGTSGRWMLEPCLLYAEALAPQGAN